MARGLGTLTVWLNADTSRFRKGMASGKVALAQFNSVVKIGMAAAGAAITAFGVSSLRSFMEAEKESNRLAAALRKVGEENTTALPALQKFASAMQRQTVYDDEAVQGMAAYALNMGISKDQIEQTTTAAMGLAARLGIDVNTAMTLLAKANAGSTAALGRYGIVLDETMTKEQKFAELLKIGAESFQLAKAESDTLSGKLTQVGNAFGDVKENIGKMISETLRLPELLDSVAQKLFEFSEYLQSNMGGFIYMGQAVLVEFKYAFLQIFTLAMNVGKGIGEIIATAGRNFQSLGEWVWENFSGLLGNIFNLAAAFGKDFVGVFYEIGQQMFAALTGQDTDWTGVLARLGQNMEKAMADAGIGELKISQPDFGDSFGKIYDDVSGLDAKRKEELEKLFNLQMDKFGKPIESPKPGDAATAKPMGQRMETSVVSAIQRGSVEALRAENVKLRKDTEIANNTKRTADGIDRLIQLIPAGAGAGGGNISVEDPF